ncbi:MAG: hypothetical protein A3K05_00135 [Candidatus Doudnabacteria bacterium RIFCSPHIGHO2_01_48_18]|nr:MAG: hypothetical protein A3K05_00135 [Candidatus Doudnabacteria bacterium RIFCSPHIGHO2_01_48_18]
MANLTKKDLQTINKRLNVLATKKDLQPITQTLARATGFLAKLSEDFTDHRAEMKNVPGILDSHTTTLDAIYKNSEHWKSEAAALHFALKRQKEWIAQIADKVGVKLEGFEF